MKQLLFSGSAAIVAVCICLAMEAIHLSGIVIGHVGGRCISARRQLAGVFEWRLGCWR
ncbi:hypothetical protein PL263_10420 [Methylomonas sp. EFPC3]|uniref:hypothetical protein n=1 Tax=Methylomonas sp. EFPC3 TaxID=3021710 RepID=UPI002416B44F|nr:hypothetical protein [Methylomonas sp. EFPC3]WFP48527.1 hypothetical protein PL263_10420 [Methylomonas sp. EFPC3]